MAHDVLTHEKHINDGKDTLEAQLQDHRDSQEHDRSPHIALSVVSLFSAQSLHHDLYVPF
jgi:hypothetical protein